jgi:hypothetical protein
MKPITPILIEFLNKHISAKLPALPKITFSVKSSKLLGDIFHHLKNAHAEYNQVSSNFNIKDIDINNGLLKGNDYHFCSAEIRKHIENTSYYQRQYSFPIKNREFVISFVYPNSKSKKQIDRFFEESIKRTYLWLYIASIYAPAKCSNKLNVYLYFTDLLKTLPTSGASIDQIHANTAATRSCNKTNEIQLYREEEWFKVLIHESFHCFGLDFSEFDCSKTTKYILNLFPVKSDVLLFETYCEMWAEIINIMFISYSSTKQVENMNITVDKMIKKTEKMLELEQEFSLFQCIKVLNFYGLDYKDLYETSDVAHTKRINRYKENTNILSYYILKSIYMFFVSDFVQWCADHNHNSINFNKSPNVLHQTQDAYCKFISEHYKDPKYIASTDSITAWFDDNINKKVLVKTESRTLRMSIYEM